MKYKLALFCFITLIINSLIGFANENIVLADSAKKEEKGIDIIVGGGLGGAYSSNFCIRCGGWGKYFSFAPVLGLGLEIPFTKAHIFSIELYSHSWLAKPSKKDDI
ncbi:MAG TPA: hypothetical protein PKY56_11910, partial [Candidatus Kapabacteria bacterium]|nr:hypothetical protein [Candidatus Kapabacteria bacterium]